MTSKSSGIDDDYKLALGSLVMEVAKLDSKVTDLIAALTEMEIDYALILVHHQQFSNKVDGLRALFRLIYPSDDDPQYQPVKEVLDRGLPQLSRPCPLARRRGRSTARCSHPRAGQAHVLAAACPRREDS